MSLITLKTAQLTVVLSTRGAELQSVRSADGNEYLWQGDPAFWANRAPILFPVCGGLKDDEYLLDGTLYPMPKHGFIRPLEWQLESATDTEAVFLMNQKAPGFPFEYALRMHYQLCENQIRIHATVQNLDTRDFVYGIGSHEAWALAGPLENYTVRFEKEEQLANYVLVGNLIKPEPVIMAEKADHLDLKTEYFAVDALVFPKLKSRSVTLTNTLNDRKVRVDYDGLDALLLWTKPGAGYVCLEPWSNAPDYTDADKNIRHKPGMIALRPGTSATRSHVVTIL